MIAPCDAITYDDAGVPTITVADFEFLQGLDVFTITPNREITKKKKLGGCTTRCSVRVNDYSGSMTLCICLDDYWHGVLTDPTAACGFAWVVFPQPANPDAPDFNTDAYFFGTAVTSGSGDWTFTADDVEDLTISIDFEGCGRNMGRQNFFDQDPANAPPAVTPVISSVLEVVSDVPTKTSNSTQNNNKK
jgi:hypothetical protein